MAAGPARSTPAASPSTCSDLNSPARKNSGHRHRKSFGGFLSCVLHLELAADGFHSRVAAVHVFRVEARVAQLDGGLAADMESVGAVDDHGLGLVELADPPRELLGIPPLSTLGDILPAHDGGPRPNVDHLDRLAGGQHLFHF